MRKFILTFDIEEWFHLLENDSTDDENCWDKFEVRIHKNMERIFQILEETDSRATFFCLGWIAKKYPEVIKEINKLGYEVGCHSENHRLVHMLTPTEFREDTKLSVDRLENIIGEKILSYRAPGFSITKTTPWAFEVLSELGILFDSSVFPASRAHGGFPSFPSNQPAIVNYQGISIKEFPVTTTNIFGKEIGFSGGGYFRLFPYYIINKWVIKQEKVLVYMHPRDIDPSQPIVSGLSLLRRFKSYYGLKHAENKFRRFLTDFDFNDIRTFEKTYGFAQIDLENYL